MVIVPPIAAFVAAGFEHSTANLYFLPDGLAIKAWAGPDFWTAIGQSAGRMFKIKVSNLSEIDALMDEQAYSLIAHE